MQDLNDLYYFASVVQHRGFSAAARATGLEKTRLSRRVAALEGKLGVRLVQRTTRSFALTEAGERFHAHCVAVLDGARSAYDSIADLRREPSGTVRVSCPHSLAQSYVAAILVDYLAAHPKVRLDLDVSDREVNLIEERFDLALRCLARMDDTAGLVARQVNSTRPILVASPSFLAQHGRPKTPQALSVYDTICRPGDVQDGVARWALVGPGDEDVLVSHTPRMITGNQSIHLDAAIRSMGIALLPEPVVASTIQSGALEHVLPDWVAETHRLFLLYPTPRGMLPSVRSLIDYLMARLSTSIQT